MTRAPGPIDALVVEDSTVMRQLVTFALERIPGVRCTEADDGVDALKKLKEKHFAIIFLDINMPMMDGLKLLETLRRKPEHNDTPVVMLTTEGRPEDVARALELGASAYLTKPVQGQQVVDMARKLLSI